MEIHVRFRDGRKYDLKYGTGLFINNSNWDMEKKMPKDKRSAKYSDECDEIRTRLFVLEQFLQQCWSAYQNDKEQSGNILVQWMNDVEWVSEEKATYVRGKKVLFTEWRIESKAAQKMAAIEKKKESDALSKLETLNARLAALSK